MKSKTEKTISSVILWMIGICFLIVALAFATPWAVYGYVDLGYADTKEKRELCKDIIDALGPVGLGVRLRLDSYMENNRLDWNDVSGKVKGTLFLSILYKALSCLAKPNSKKVFLLIGSFVEDE